MTSIQTSIKTLEEEIAALQAVENLRNDPIIKYKSEHDKTFRHLLNVLLYCLLQKNKYPFEKYKFEDLEVVTLEEGIRALDDIKTYHKIDDEFIQKEVDSSINMIKKELRKIREDDIKFFNQIKSIIIKILLIPIKIIIEIYKRTLK